MSETKRKYRFDVHRVLWASSENRKNFVGEIARGEF
jgi:hypothetical protein